MKWTKRIIFRLEILKELLSFLWKRKMWWIIPIVIIFIFLGILVWFVQNPAAAPFIYTLF